MSFDPEKERDHCEAVEDSLLRSAEAYSDVLMRERAAVRAECEGELERLHECLSVENLRAVVAETKLSALRAAVGPVIHTFNTIDGYRQHELRALRRAWEASK